MTDNTGVWVDNEPTVTVTADPFELDVVHGMPQEVIAR